MPPPPVRRTEPESPFRLVAAGTFALHPLRDRLWLSAGDDGLAFAELRGRTLVRDEALARGVQRCSSWNVLSLAETHRDDLWLFDDFHPWSVCPPPARLFRRTKTGPWKLQGMLRAHWIDVGPWIGASTLIAEVPLRPGPPWGYTLRTVGSARAPVPKQWSRNPKSGACWTELEFPRALFSNSAGEAVVVAVSRCTPVRDEDEAEEAPAIDYAVAERFDKDGTSARIALPVALDSNSAVVGRGPNAVWTLGTDVEGRTALVRGQGRTFEITDYLPTGATLLDADTDGTVWTLQDGALARRGADGVWRRVPLPAGAGTLVSLHAASPDDVWLVLDDGVYRTLPTEPVALSARACTAEEVTRFEAAAGASSPREPQQRSARAHDAPKPCGH